MKFRYAVLGSGRQGCAAAYDLARWGDAKVIILADQDLETAQKSAKRVNELIGRSVAEPQFVDVTKSDSVDSVLDGVDAFLSAVPYYYNLELTQAALRAKAHMVDLGGNTDIVRKQHAFHNEAAKAKIAIIPDCGQVPGMGGSLMVYSMELLDDVTDVFMWDGGIPQHPRPPFNYLLTFNIAGLTNEYAEPAIFLRNGKITKVEPMTELETIEFPPPIGILEAFVAGGGTSTMPWTYKGKLNTLQNLTLRYPGNLAHLRAFYDLGLWELEPIQVGDVNVIPRDVFHTLFEPKVTFSEEKDLVIVRIKALGKFNGKPAEAVVELIDYFDEETEFTAMERATGWSAAIVLEMASRGQIQHGSGGVEEMVPARLFVENLRQHGFSISESVVQKLI